MDILMVSAELGPYARATRTGDSVAALSKALAQTGHDVTVVLPRYPLFESSGLLVARRLTPLRLEDVQVTVFDGQLATGVKIALLDSPELFDRPGIFGEGEEKYPDNAQRFGLFCRAAVALIRLRAEQGQKTDAVHLHDWAAAAVGPLLADSKPRPGVVLTLHDAAGEPLFPKTKVPEWMKTPAFKAERGISPSRGGVAAADVVTTVSPSYAADLESGSVPSLYTGTLCERSERTAGVLNGLDYAIYNPATDPALRGHYDAEDAEGKGSAKIELLREEGLELRLGRPLVVALVEDDLGRDLLGKALHDILKQDLSLVVLGPFAPEVEQRFDGDPARLDGVCAFEASLDDVALRKAAAAADLMLIPRRYEAEGFVPRCAQRYGALPVAFAGGAVRDAVVDCDAHLETGTGFLFSEPTVPSMLGALGRALGAYGSPRFPSLRRRVMRLDLGWDRPARRYVQLYRQAGLLANAKG